MHQSKIRNHSLIAAICIKDTVYDAEALSEHASMLGWSPVIYKFSEAHIDFVKSNIEAGAIQIILANDLSQLGRHWGLTHFSEVLHLCSRHGVLLATPRMVFNPSVPSDWMLLMIDAGISEFTSRNLHTRLREGRRKAFLGGKWLGGSPPAPYIFCHRTQTLVVDERQLADLQRVWVLSESMRPRQIARDLGMTEARIRRVLADDRLLFYQAKRLEPQTCGVIQCTWKPVMSADQAERIRATRSSQKG